MTLKNILLYTIKETVTAFFRALMTSVTAEAKLKEMTYMFLTRFGERQEKYLDQ